MNVQSEAAVQGSTFLQDACRWRTHHMGLSGTWRTSSMCLGIQGSTVTSSGKSKAFLTSLFQASPHCGPLSGWRRTTKASPWGGVRLEVGQIFTSRLTSWRAASAHTDGSSALSCHFLPQAASFLSSSRVAVSSALGREDPGLAERLSSYEKPEQRLLSSLLPIIDERSRVRI